MTSRNPSLDLSQIPALDTHCHPFPLTSSHLTSDMLRDSISVSLRGITSRLNETMMLSRVTLRELSSLLDCDAEMEAVVAARNARSAQSYHSYISELYQDQNIAGLLFDPGFPPDPEIDGSEFAQLVPVPAWEGYRIERFFRGAGSFHGDAGSLAAESFSSVLEAFEAELDRQAMRPGFAFFKSIIAYRTGLAVQPVTRSDAAMAWDEHRFYGDAPEKIVRDYLLAVTCQKARQYDVPVQIHTGHTSHVNLWPNVNPILMTPFLGSPGIVDTRIVLVHGGYPYCTEAGYLTSVFPNVWCDLSLMIPWASVGIARRIEETLESAPTSKVMYGSDGINIPEMNWLGALVGKRGLARALTTIAEDEFIDLLQAEEIAADILHRTAESVYGLKSRDPVPKATAAGQVAGGSPG